MSKKIIFYILYLALFITFSTESVLAKDDGTVATQEETKHFVAKYLKENLDVNFTTKDILSVESVFDVEDNLLAHHYKLININSEKFFFVISAQKKYSPILEAGKGEIEDIKLSNNDSAKKYFMGGISVVTADNADQLLNTIIKIILQLQKSN